ncbi:uncharacterized protein LOC111674334 [Orussus abietinus]|uniref:uncharacterized protein LOC111674334 n=1 Tax=Orussus abietinus TaxID=222816 RepID=UPI000C715CEF|nr:uncharacterized protein LOC111674334 [Orussus abietinus]
MTNNLARKHKSSLTLVKNPPTTNDCGSSSEVEQDSRNFHLSLFLSISCLMFLLYWIVLCPLLWACLQNGLAPRSWPRFWPFAFWFVALLVWLLIMSLFVALWKYLIRRKQSRELEIDKRIPQDWTPLLSHKSMSKKENLQSKEKLTGQTESTNDEEIRKKTSMETELNEGCEKDDLQLVRIATPCSSEAASEESENTKMLSEDPEQERMSPVTPLSPRQLFFINFLRQAEVTGKSKKVKDLPMSSKSVIESSTDEVTNTAKERQFKEEGDKSKDTVEINESCIDKPVTFFDEEIGSFQLHKEEFVTDKDPDSKSSNKSENQQKEVCEAKAPNLERSKVKSQYFIADVEPLANKKTEVFLRIEPDSGIAKLEGAYVINVSKEDSNSHEHDRENQESFSE